MEAAQLGSIEACANGCDSPVTYVVSHGFSTILNMEGKQEAKCIRSFLCKLCFDRDYRLNFDPSMDLTSFTFTRLADYRKRVASRRLVH